MTDETERNPQTGRSYKITSFSKEYAAKKGHACYFLALFERGQLESKNGWQETNRTRARKDGKAFIAKND